MSDRLKSPYFVAAIAITLANVALIWMYRFLPLFDYPLWLFEVHVLRELSAPWFASHYELVRAPVPNLGFVGPVWLLSFLFPLEVCGKIFLTGCVVGLPWAFWYCVRRLANNHKTPVAYLGFPFAFNVFFFGGQAFLLGFIVLLFMVGVYFPKLNHLSLPDWILLSFLLLAAYFIHALAFVLIVLVFLGGFLSTASKKTTLTAFALTLVPALTCLIWYYASVESQLPTELKWSGWALAQNVFKAPFLFIKSYGIPNPIPLTLLNVSWFIVLLVFVMAAIKVARTTKVMDSRFILPIVASVVLMFALPEILFGVYRPGTRFGFPLIFLILLAVCRAQMADRWRRIALAVAGGVLLYNGFHFSSVNRQMQELQADLKNVITADGSFCVIRFDWPPDRNLRDIAAASIDPLFGGMYYHQLDRRGVGWVFGTALLQLRDEHQNLKPVLVGDTPADHASSFIHSGESVYAFKYILLVGSDAAARTVADSLLAKGFVVAEQKEHWTILELTVDRE